MEIEDMYFVRELVRDNGEEYTTPIASNIGIPLSYDEALEAARKYSEERAVTALVVCVCDVFEGKRIETKVKHTNLIE